MKLRAIAARRHTPAAPRQQRGRITLMVSAIPAQKTAIETIAVHISCASAAFQTCEMKSLMSRKVLTSSCSEQTRRDCACRDRLAANVCRKAMSAGQKTKHARRKQKSEMQIFPGGSANRRMRNSDKRELAQYLFFFACSPSTPAH